MKKKPYKHIDTVSPQIVEMRKQGIQIRSKSWGKLDLDNRSQRRQAKKDLKKDL